MTTLPKSVVLDDTAAQLLGIEPIDGLEGDGFDVEIPVNLIPAGVLSGWNVSVSQSGGIEGGINESTEEIEQKIARAMRGVQADLKNALDSALKSSAWKWRGGGARDIYDTGRLLDSGKVVLDGTRLSIVYTAPYASIVHDGGYIFPYGNKNRRPIYLPGRPWISSTLYGGGPVPKFDFRASLLRHID